jgi:Suppressor of fused protein (SUFU)
VTNPARDESPVLFRHVERYLGPVNASWIETIDGKKSPFQVVRCAGRVVDTVFFCTLGLSNHPFPHHPGAFRHELLIAVPKTFGTRNIPPLLQQLGAIALERNRPFFEGDVMLGKNPVFIEWPFRGFFASHPCVIEDDGFAACTREDGQPIHFVWMAPLYESEIEFVRRQGLSRLEDLFIQRRIDLVDLNRRPAVD